MVRADLNGDDRGGAAQPGQDRGRFAQTRLGRFWLAKRKSRDWRNLPIFLIALIIALALWFLNKLNHEYSIEVNCPVVLEAAPVGSVISGQSERTLPLRIRGQGYALLRYKWVQLRHPHRINLREQGAVLTGKPTSRQCLTRSQLEQIFGQNIPKDLQLERVLTENLCYDLSRSMRRRLPVRPSVSYSLPPQYAQFEANQLLTDSVWASGPSAALETLQFVTNDTIYLGQIDEPQRLALRLDASDGIECEPAVVEYYIPVSQYTTKRLRIPIRVDMQEPGVEVKLLPATVDLTCQVPVDHYSQIVDSLFTVTANLSPVSQPRRLLIEITEQPDMVKNIQFSPKYADYLVTKK